MSKQPSVMFLNPRTCGIYKDGGTRFKTDAKTGIRTTEIDNELLEHVTAYLQKGMPSGAARIGLEEVFGRQVLVPTYYDQRYDDGIEQLLEDNGLEGVTIGELIKAKHIMVRGGHGSPSNDQRSGHIPYVKVSDIRGLRININPTNLVSGAVAARFWRGTASRLEPWDLITPNRASSNIGEFAILLPGEEQVVLTKEVFVFRIVTQDLFDPFYLLWALSLRAVRDQWRRIALMQTNREDCGSRYLEIIVPKPPSKKWALDTSEAFREYFTTISKAKAEFVDKVGSSKFGHVANVISAIPSSDADDDDSV
jgi:type I restriction enzyme M protein